MNYSSGWFYSTDPFSYGTLTAAVDSRTDTLIADILPLFKKHARISVSEDDDLCELYLNGALSRIEQWTMMPILPKAYDWSQPTYLQGNDSETGVFLPLRNAVPAGEQFGFELLVAAKFAPLPATWPMHLEVGFSAGSQIPLDLKLAAFELAQALYELRTTPEMVDVYADSVMKGSLSRYWVPRV